MPRTVLTVQSITRTGLDPSYGAANADGISVENDGSRVMIHVKNGGGSPISVTIDTPGTVDGLAISDLSVSVPASGERFIGPFPTKHYNQEDGTVHIDFSAVTSVTIAALKL